MITAAAKQTLVPFAACFHIGYSDERLRTHPNKRSNSNPLRAQSSAHFRP
jgi:hypothetical protein